MAAKIDADFYPTRGVILGIHQAERGSGRREAPGNCRGAGRRRGTAGARVERDGDLPGPGARPGPAGAGWARRGPAGARIERGGDLRWPGVLAAGQKLRAW